MFRNTYFTINHKLQSMLQNAYPIEERNQSLLNVFRNLGYDAKLVGNKNQPKIVINNDFAISGYVQNKLYHFTTKPFGGDIVQTISLNIFDPITKKDVDRLIEQTEKRKVWKIYVKQEDKKQNRLFYVKTDNFIPYFSTEDFRFFFDEQKVIETVEYLSSSYGIYCDYI